MTRGRIPKPAHMRQNKTKKVGRTTLNVSETGEFVGDKRKTPPLQNPDKRKWHKFTKAWWRCLWASPMVEEYLPVDILGLARLAILIDDYYKYGGKEKLSEIRMQEARFGLSPADRSRLQWEVPKGDEAGKKKTTPQRTNFPSPVDPRGILGVVK